MGFKDAELSILVTDNKEIIELNKIYRGKSKPTDVLSFPIKNYKFPTRKLPQGFLGDLVVSFPVTKQQARYYEVSFQEEFTRLLIHGVLHLIGYDHEGVSNTVANKMRRLEKKLFKELTTE